MAPDKKQLSSRGWDDYFDESYDSAVDHFKRALEIDADFVDALRGLALSYLDMKKLQDAERAVRQALALEKHNDALWHDLGRVMEEQEDFNEAKYAYIRAIELNDSVSDYYLSWGHLELSRDEYANAEFAMKAAVRHQPKDPLNWQQLALVYQIQGKTKESQEAWDEADRLMGE